MGGSTSTPTTSNHTSGLVFTYKVEIAGDGPGNLDHRLVETALTLGMERLFHSGSLGRFGRARRIEAELHSYAWNGGRS